MPGRDGVGGPLRWVYGQNRNEDADPWRRLDAGRFTDRILILAVPTLTLGMRIARRPRQKVLLFAE